MPVDTYVNEVQRKLKELREEERGQRLSYMEASILNTVFAMSILIFSIMESILLFSSPSYYPANYTCIYIGLPISMLFSLFYLCFRTPGIALSVFYMLLMFIAAILIVSSNIHFMIHHASSGEKVISLIINICYFSLLVLESIQVSRLGKKRNAHVSLNQKIVEMKAKLPRTYNLHL